MKKARAFALAFPILSRVVDRLPAMAFVTSARMCLMLRRLVLLMRLRRMRRIRVVILSMLSISLNIIRMIRGSMIRIRLILILLRVL